MTVKDLRDALKEHHDDDTIFISTFWRDEEKKLHLVKAYGDAEITTVGEAGIVNIIIDDNVVVV